MTTRDSSRQENMKLQDDILAIADAVEDVILHRPGSDRYAEIAGALARKTREQDKRRESRPVSCLWTTWHLPKNHIPMEPVSGDEILDSKSNRWMITKIDRSEWPGTLRCVSCRLNTTFGMDDYVDLFRQWSEPEKFGIVEYRWFLIRAGIPARFSETEVSENRLETRRLVFPAPVDLHIGDRLRFPDGAYWRIENIVTPQDVRLWTEVKIMKIPTRPPHDT